MLMRILVAEGDPDTATMLDAILTMSGHSAVLVDNGSLALDELQGGGFDAVLTDVFMPVMDGLDLMQLCADLVPVVATSVRAELGEKALNDGAVAFIEKPVTAAKLIDALEECAAELGLEIHCLV